MLCFGRRPSANSCSVRGPDLALLLPLAFAAGDAPSALFDPDVEDGDGCPDFDAEGNRALYSGDFTAFSCTHFGARSNPLGSKPSSVSHQNHGLLVSGGTSTPRARRLIVLMLAKPLSLCLTSTMAV